MLGDAGDERVGDLSFAIDQVDRVIDLKIRPIFQDDKFFPFRTVQDGV